ncbi:DUF4439 domain-containing protein [Sinomonas sp. ASV486]|uniref:DUF4439 domain-containing protein n=1 Tax=Sinomonas sp. ASV486 TaxID=3051170 RepID=UPI0027DB23C2|nr:DUF4439 domain-containing protein [Sinomonas sp. ASV486]MDQ4490493.1 DUF4439 domain-containing protein [Sinomonas sp. ASV486]
MNSTTPPSPDPARPDASAARQESARRVRPWVWAVALGAAAVIGAGASLVAAPPPPATPPTASAAAMTRAHDDAARLAAMARLLARSPTVPDDAARRGALHAADVLDLQAGVLAASLPSRSTSTSPSTSPSQGAVSSPSSESSSGVQDSPALVITGLSASAAARASDLRSVDGPTAALLASVAAGQALEAARYAHAAGAPTPAPTLTAPEPTATPPSAGQSTGSSTPSTASAGPATSSGGPSACSAPASQPQSMSPSQPRSPSQSPSATNSALPATQSLSQAPSEGAANGQSAFVAVEQAEQAAVWTYTVLAARTEAAARTSNLAAAGLHQAQLRSLVVLAERACAALPAPDAGFGLAADAGTPAQLAALEQSVAAAWSGLVGASTPDFRTTAAEGLLGAARRADAVGAQSTLAASAFPGHAGGRAEAEALGSAATRAASATSAAPSPGR